MKLVAHCRYAFPKTGVRLAGIVHLAIALLWLAAIPVTAQPTEIDWRSAVILHFDSADDAAAIDEPGGYIAGITRIIEAERLAEFGIAAVAIGPLGNPTAQADVGSDAFAANASVGARDEWRRFAVAAKTAGLVPMVYVAHHIDAAVCADLAKWTAETEIRHMIVDDPPGCEMPALGTAVDTMFDVVVETISNDVLRNGDALRALYARRSEEIAAGTNPVVAAVVLPPESDDLTARALMLPGPLLLTLPSTGAPNEMVKRLAAFRASHPAIGSGEHVDLVNNVFTFARTAPGPGTGDAIVVVMHAAGQTTVNVSRVFADNALLQDALTGATSFVSFGMANFDAGPTGVLLIEEAH